MNDKHTDRIFGTHYSPYMTKDRTNMDSWYEVCKADPHGSISIDGVEFRKIIWRCEFYLSKSPALLVMVDPPEPLNIGDILVDENGSEFTIKQFEMIHFSVIPEWYPRLAPALITGRSYDIGEYLAKKPADPNR